MMLESAIKFEKAFDILSVVDGAYKDCPTNEEWSLAKKMCEFLEPFYETTNLISGSSYPTSNLYFMQVWKIECLLEDNQTCDDVVIMNMTFRMKMKFDKYWKDYSTVLAFGAILDPRLKLKFLRFCYKKLDPSTFELKANEVLEKFKRLYGEYINTFGGSTISQSSNQSPMSPEEGRLTKKSKMVMKEFREFDCETQTSKDKDELEIYLKEGLIHTNEDDLKYDVLNFWKINEDRFPTLSVMARDVLSIPITTVASESAFSIGGRVLTKYRSSTLHAHVQMLICTRSWLRGFVPNHDA
ncbi:zinc finger BED domain-containing protein RICESLEEPER 1-like [Arachis duranensis]|uniref:Zinc finger BED domain-containing protein RICESLEEPER 1-like n=1 Tax=Arachis duranensis TaxID=130453 RepID=A0A6P5MS89_ARADU|nr:zinc finger BED domain-containing protein RICESLEEPER 1-like [Arachis duranensis]